MAYITDTEFKNRYGSDEHDELLGHLASAEATAKATRAYDEASAIVDGYLRARYTVPFTDPPFLVEDLTLKIARYKLWDEAPSTRVMDDYKEAVTTLKDLSANRMSLDLEGDGTNAEPASSPGKISTTTPETRINWSSY